jgi:tetratricopeptide (TPR) repeat protein
MVRRLVPREGVDMMSFFMIERNLDDIFLYRGVLTKDWQVDRSVYKDPDTERMFVNFGVAMAQLSQQKAMNNQFEEAVRRIEIALRLDPTLKAAKIMLGTYYLLAGQDEKAIAHYIEMIRQEPEDGEYWLRLARVYEYKNQYPFAIQNINEGIRLAPDTKELYLDGFRIAARMGDAQTAKDYFRQWLQRHPDDQEMRKLLLEADGLLEREFNLKMTGEKNEGRAGT